MERTAGNRNIVKGKIVKEDHERKKLMLKKIAKIEMKKKVQTL